MVLWVLAKRCTQAPVVPSLHKFWRIKEGWKSFNEHKIDLKSSIPNSSKKKLSNQYVLSAITYASGTWTLTKTFKQRLLLRELWKGQ